MNTISTTELIRAKVQLVEGEDYTKDDLEFDRLIGAGHYIKTDKLLQIARSNGYDRCEWSGKTYKAGDVIEATFTKDIIVDRLAEQLLNDPDCPLDKLVDTIMESPELVREIKQSQGQIAQKTDDSTMVRSLGARIRDTLRKILNQPGLPCEVADTGELHSSEPSRKIDEIARGINKTRTFREIKSDLERLFKEVD